MLTFVLLTLCVAFTGATNSTLDPKKILCPVLASMYNAGDLKTDSTGRVQVWSLKEALMNGLGVRNSLAEFQAVGVAAYTKDDVNETHRDRCFEVLSKCWWEKVFKGNVTDKSNRWLNIFTMNGHPNVEHGFSTGVRGGATNVPVNVCGGNFPCQKRFDEFYTPFANAQGRFYRKDLEKIVCYTKVHGDRGGEFSYASLRTSREWQMHLAVDGWLTAFGWTDEKGDLFLTLDDIKRMSMEGQYPIGWKKRDWGCLFTGCTGKEDKPAMKVISTALSCPDKGWWSGSECETLVDESCTPVIGYCKIGNSTCIGNGGISGRCTCKKGFCARNGGCVKRNFDCEYFGKDCVVY